MKRLVSYLAMTAAFATAAHAEMSGNAVKIGKVHISLAHGFRNQAVDMFKMAASGNFRDNPAERAVFVKLRQDDTGQNMPLIVDNGGGSFVTACLNP